MATISFNDEAPQLDKGDKVRFTFAFANFELGAGETLDTDTLDEAVRDDAIANARVNPWLKVEFPDVEPEVPVFNAPVIKAPDPSPAQDAPTPADQTAPASDDRPPETTDAPKTDNSKVNS